MKIEQLLLQEHGQKIGGMTLTVKTSKKTWQIEKIWWQQVIFMDNTGEIPADIKIGEFIPIIRGAEVRVIVAEVREAEYLGKPRKILVVDQYKIPTLTPEEWEVEMDEMKQLRDCEIRGKIKCLLTAQKVSTGASLIQIKEFVDSQTLTEIIDRIME